AGIAIRQPVLSLAHRRLPALCSTSSFSVLFFFFQAEDGIRDPLVTGVQTCALPISAKSKSAACAPLPPAAAPSQAGDNAAPPARTTRPTAPPAPSPPEIWLAASSSCTAQSQSSSPGSSVSSLRHSNLTGCGKRRA